MRIIVKLTLGFLCAVTLMLVVGFVTTNISERALKRAIAESSTLHAQEMLREIDRVVMDRMQALLLIGQRAVIVSALQESNDYFGALPDRAHYIQEQDLRWQANDSVIINELLAKAPSVDLRSSGHVISEFNDYPVFGELFVTNRYGALVAATNPTSDYRQDDEIWWQEAVEHGWYIGKAVYDESADMLIVELAIKLTDEKGRFIGVLKGGLNLYESIVILKENLAVTRKQFSSIQYFLANDVGKVLYSSSKEVSRQEHIATYFGVTIADLFTQRPGFNFLETTKGRYGGGSLLVYTQSRGYKDFLGTGWLLVIQYATDEVFASVRKQRKMLLIFLVIMTIVAIVVALIVSQSISSSVGKLQRATVAIGRGDLKTRINIISNDEMQDLAQSFNRMAENLERITGSRDALDREVDERKQIQQKLETVNSELIKSESNLSSMLADLNKAHEELKSTQRQLLQSEKLASLGQLSAGVAHEINNPLSFIHSNLSTLSQYIENINQLLQLHKGLQCAVQKGSAAEIERAVAQLKSFYDNFDVAYTTHDINNLVVESQEGVTRIRNIVSDLKTFSRQDEGVKAPSNINEILDGVLNIVWNELKHKAALVKDYGELPLIECNAQQIGQVFINILVNAVQAIEESGTITIKTYTRDDRVYIEISDTGSGISPENINKIFDPFFTTKDVGQGTGLGLSISYEMVKKHNGGIEVRSKPGQGTTFIAWIPIT